MGFCAGRWLKEGLEVLNSTPVVGMFCSIQAGWGCVPNHMCL